MFLVLYFYCFNFAHKEKTNYFVDFFMDPQINNKTIDNQLLRIARYLIINAGFLSDISLCHGKMGIAIFFFHYGRYSGNSVYTEFAWDLIDDIYKNIHNGLPVNFENGLCGTGWGIEYLVQHKFIEGDTGEVLEDLDKLVMERDPRRITDLSFEKGLGGIHYYVSVHTHSPFCSAPAFDPVYLEELKQRANVLDTNALTAKGYPTFDASSPLSLPAYLLRDKVGLKDDADITQYPSEVKKGLAGIGLQLMNV